MPSSSDSINSEVEQGRVSRFDQGPRTIITSEPIASTSTLPTSTSTSAFKSDTNGHLSKNGSAESYRFTSSTSRQDSSSIIDKASSSTPYRSTYIPSYSSASSKHDDRSSSSYSSKSSIVAESSTRTSPSSSSRAVPPPPTDYFLPQPVKIQASLDFAPRLKKPRPIQPTQLEKSTIITKTIPNSNLNSFQNSRSRSPESSTSTTLPPSIPTGPRRATVYALGPSQANHQNSYIPSTSSRQSEHSQQSTSTTAIDDPRRSSIPSIIPTPSASTSRPPPSDPIPPDHYKPSGTKDFKVTYDRALDNESVKAGGRDLVYRYDGEGVNYLPTDPRKNTDRATLEKLSKAKGRIVMEPSRLRYNWDKNSTGPVPPPPPSAVLVTGFPGSTTSDQIHRHFTSYGRIASIDSKTDPKTGGSLGICWISYIDDKPRGTESDLKAAKEKYERESRKGTAQDGYSVAKAAVLRGNGSKIGARMMSMSDVVEVVMDGDGKLTKAAVEVEISRRNAPIPVVAPPFAPTPRPPPPPLPPQQYQPPPPPPILPPSDSPPRPPASIFVPSVFNNNPLKPVPLPFKPSVVNNNSFSGNNLPSGRYPPSNLPSNPEYSSNGFGSNFHRNALNSLPQHPITSPLPPKFPLPLPPTHSQVPPSIPSGPRASHSLPVAPHRQASFSNGSRPSSTFNGPTAAFPLFNRDSSFSQPSGSGTTTMSEAIAAAILAAKKRLDATQKKVKSKVDDGEADMDLDSDVSKGDSDEEEDGSDKVEKVEDKIFYHRDSRHEGKKFLARGQAPANAVAWQASRQILKSKLLANDKPYLFINKTKYTGAREFGRYGNPPVLNGGDLERHFNAFELDRTYADSNGWYITFTNSTSARQAFSELDGKRFANAPLELTYFDSPSETFATTNQSDTRPIAPMPSRPKVKKLMGWTDAELIEEAKEIVINDLLVAFKNDLQNRVVSGRIWEHLAKNESGGSKSMTFHSNSGTQVKELKSISSLPSFSKKKATDEGSLPPPGLIPTVQRFDSEAPSDSIDYATEGRDSNHSDATSRLKTDKHNSTTQGRKSPISKKKNKKTIKIQSGSEADDSNRKSHSLSKKQHGKKVIRPKVEMNYTSSEAEAEDSDVGTPLIKTSSVTIETSVPPSIETPSVEPEEMEEVEEEEEQEEESRPEEDVICEDAILEEALPVKKKRGRPVGWRKPTFPPLDGGLPPLPVKKDSLPPNQINLQVDSDRETESDYANQTAKALKLSTTTKVKRPYNKVMRVSPPPRIPSPTPPPSIRPPFIFTQPDGPTPDPFETGVAADSEDLFYLKLAIERYRIGISLHPDPPLDENEFSPEANLRHPTGSARTEGYYPISVAEKIANRAPTNRAKAAYDTGATAGSGVAVSRLARVNTRGLVRGMELHKKVMDSDTDVLKFNQLRTRKKQLTFSRSGIEGYGLFAMEHIPVGEMVIEYVGELIRQQVADRREKAYERQGIGSSYLFRVDEDLVVDATKKGNLGRLINHCCAPNCTARIITINGVKKIVIYAKTNIEPGDEVTYDYHFPHEDDKIPCLCAHPLCRKYLN